MSRHQHRRKYLSTPEGLVELTPQDFPTYTGAAQVLAPNESDVEEEEFVQEVALATLRADAQAKEMRLFLAAIEYPRSVGYGVVTQTQPPLVAQRERDPDYVPGYA